MKIVPGGSPLTSTPEPTVTGPSSANELTSSGSGASRAPSSTRPAEATLARLIRPPGAVSVPPASAIGPPSSESVSPGSTSSAPSTRIPAAASARNPNAVGGATPSVGTAPPARASNSSPFPKRSSLAVLTCKEPVTSSVASAPNTRPAGFSR